MKNADKWFSIYIRLRDSNEDGVGECCTCGKHVHWKQGDAGHFVNRQHKSLRYSEDNVHLQCRKCNRFDEGNITGYSIFMINKFGSDILSKLSVAKNVTVKMGKYELSQIAFFYKSKAKELAKLKRIQL